MTMKQKKGVRAAVLMLLFLLLAIGTFDSRHGYLAAQGGSGEVVSGDNADPGEARTSSLPAERVASVRALPGAEEHGRAVATGKTVENEVEVTVEKPPEPDLEKVVQVVEGVFDPVDENPAPGSREKPRNGSDEPYLFKADDPDPDPVHKPDPDPGRGSDPGQDSASGSDPGKESGPGVVGDRNKGHGNDGDGYDEDNPGRGGFGGVGSAKEGRGHGGSGVSGGQGNSGSRKGSGGRGGGRGRGKS